MLEFLALGTIWFWIVLFFVGVAVTILVECEQGFYATVTLIATVVALNYGLKYPILHNLTAHPLTTAGWVGIYFAAGIVWGLLKWFVFLHKKAAQYREARDAFLAKNNATELTPALAVKLMGELGNYGYNGISPISPKASEHKGDILRWMTYWPFSIVGTVLNDFVRKIWTHIYNFMAEMYDGISKYVFRKYAGDVELAKRGAAEREAETDADRRRH